MRGWIAPNASWSLPVHPVQLYDSLLWLSLFVVQAWLPTKLLGLRFSLLLIVHGSGRFVEQFFRGDFQSVLGPLSLTQLISVLFVATGAVVVWVRFGVDRVRNDAGGLLLV